MYKIAAYITAYQDIKALHNCIASIQQQSYLVKSIFIIDNSPQLLLQANVTESIVINHYPENIGISGGLRLGLQWAVEQKYDFLWTFDQDSQPLPDVLEKLVKNYDKLTKLSKRIGIVAPVPVDSKTGQVWHGIIFDKYRFIETPFKNSQRNFYKCDAVITSGSLISLEAAQNIPLPEEDFFIDAVDWEYCLKFKQNNYEIYVIKDAILNHRFGQSRRIKTILKKREVTTYHYSSLRYYYMCRNHTFVETRLALTNHHLFRSILRRLEFLVLLLGKIIFYEPPFTWLKIWACLRGTYDGLIGRLGKTW